MAWLPSASPHPTRPKRAWREENQRPPSKTHREINSIDRDPCVGLPVDGEELFILGEHLEQADLAGRAWPDAMGAGGVAEREAGSGATERRRGARGGGAPFSVE